MKIYNFNLNLLLFCSGISLLKFAIGVKDVELIDVANMTTTTVSTIIHEDMDMAKCSKELKGCCNEMSLGDEEPLMKCFTLHQNKIPNEGDKDITKAIKFLSCFVECIYKQKKYVGKGDTINMKMVKSDAAKMFEHRPKERDYYIEMHEFCRKDASTMYNMVRLNPATMLMMRDTCKPYLMFVFFCQSDYHKKHSCPYFKWEDNSKAKNKVCKAAKEKCYEIDGIKL